MQRYSRIASKSPLSCIRRPRVAHTGRCKLKGSASRETFPCLEQQRRWMATKRQQRAAAASGTLVATSNESTSVEVDPSYIKKRRENMLKFHSDDKGDIILPRVDFEGGTNLTSSPWFPSNSNSSNDIDKPVVDIDPTDLYDPDMHLPSAPTDWTKYEAATPLWQDLAALIGVTGQPMSTAEYMRACLTHPVHGYYVNAGNHHRGGTTVAGGSSTNQQHLDDFDVDDYGEEEADEVEGATEGQAVIGPEGDFVTAPELSQVFGESLGVWFYTQHQQLQKEMSPGKLLDWQWLECGPGKGTLMSDLLRFGHQGKLFHQFGTSLKYVHLVEASPVLRKTQEATFKKDLKGVVKLEFCHPDIDGPNRPTAPPTDPKVIQVHWHDSVASFRAWQKTNNSKLTTYVVGQEFLDALPAYQFEKTAEGPWRERLVDVALRHELMEPEDRERMETSLKSLPADTKIPRMRIVIAPEATAPLRTLLQVDEHGNMHNEPPSAQVGSVVEVSPEAILLVQDVAKLVDEQGGAALWIDYGQAGSADTIRSFARHEQVHFLSRPGQVDVTVDVDFRALEHSVNSLGTSVKAFGPVGQGQFLVSMGATDRVIQLIESDSTTEQQAEDLYASLMRLADPSEMGERFKVLAIAKSEAPPPGFEPQP